MADPLRWFEPLVATPTDAVRWACILEATAPKPGNVFPGRPFDNLRYLDFVTAAEITADCFARAERISEGMLAAVEETASRCKTNVNLGIVLLLGPLVAADRRMLEGHVLDRNPAIWTESISGQLAELDDLDGQNVFRAIAAASAGGLGHVDQMDIHHSAGPVDLLAAMQLAADRDQIARQYVTAFDEVVHQVVPLLHQSIDHCGDVLQGICRAHVRLLAASPDSLISRKNGYEAAQQVQTLAGSIDLDDRASIENLDASLRTSDHRRNPGTTADLIAAGLYLLLRTPKNRET